MSKIAIFPGSFDPFTVGHESIVLKGLQLFDKIIVAVGTNIQKTEMFSLKTRMNIIKKVFEGDNRVEVENYTGLTVDFCRARKINFLIRGLRTSADFEFERSIAQVNKQMEPKIETIFLLTSTKYSPISSSVVRDILANGGDASKFLPKSIDIKKYLKR